MLLGHTDTTKPATLRGTDRLRGFSGGGFSTSGEIFDAVIKDSTDNESMFGLQQVFHDTYTENMRRVLDLTGENIPDFSTVRFLDVARSLSEGKELGRDDQSGYVVDLDAINQKLTQLKNTHPDIQTFEDMFGSVKANAKTTENTAIDALDRATNFGSVVGFMSGMVGAFNANDPLNIATLPLGGFGKAAATRVATEMGVGALSETINQFLGVKENRELLGLENSVWRSAQQVLFAAGGAGAFRGVIEVAPVGARALERKVAPQRALGRELLQALEEVGVPVRSDVFLQNVVDLAPEKVTRRADTRAGRQILDQEIRFRGDNALGDTPEGVAEHHKRAQDAAEEYRAGLEAEVNGAETPRPSIFDGMNLRGVEEFRGVPVERVQEILDTASKDIDAEITIKNERVAQLNNDVAAAGEKVTSAETAKFSDFLSEVSPTKADELAEIEQMKSMPGLGKTRRGRIAKAENDIRESPEGKQAAVKRKEAVEEGRNEAKVQTKKIQGEQKELRALELKRNRIRNKAQKGIDTRPKKILNPSEDKARAEGVKLDDGEAPRVPGIGDRGGLSPAEHVQTTVARLEAGDADIPQRANETVARVESSFDETDGTYDIGASRRVSGDMKVALDDGTIMSLRDHLKDIAENEKVVEAVRSCAI
jgi:hypothetical protein